MALATIIHEADTWGISMEKLALAESDIQAGFQRRNLKDMNIDEVPHSISTDLANLKEIIHHAVLEHHSSQHDVMKKVDILTASVQGTLATLAQSLATIVNNATVINNVQQSQPIAQTQARISQMPAQNMVRAKKGSRQI